MTHSITPPPELRSKWFNEAPKTDLYDYIIEQAAQWGADQELEACCEWLHWQNLATHPELIPSLRAARRPKPSSLKEQALAELAEWENVMDIAPDSPIRRALEALDD
jgi:hypothetical protein